MPIVDDYAAIAAELRRLQGERRLIPRVPDRGSRSGETHATLRV